MTRTPATWTDLRRQQPITGDAQAGLAKSAVCAACHGPQGLAIAPNFPNLAGQSATYLYVQLKTLKSGQRSDPIMSGQAATLSDTDMRNLAAYYSSLPAKPAGHSDAASRGGRLFLDGDPTQGVPPCQGCHGPTGQGPRVYSSDAPQPPWSTFPRLHGQSAIYVTKALGDFSGGARSGTSNALIMHGVAQTLGDADIQALSTYIATQ
ncbi:cytochrome C [Rhodanobacter sp. C05]|nr:cytochrome C [Rhodanobacter sp. C05]